MFTNFIKSNKKLIISFFSIAVFALLSNELKIQGALPEIKTNEYEFESSGTHYKTIEVKQINLFTSLSPNDFKNEYFNHYEGDLTFWPFVHFIRDEAKWLPAERWETQTLIRRDGFNGLFYEFGFLEFCVYSSMFIIIILINFATNKEKYFKVDKKLKIKEGFSLKLIDYLLKRKVIINGITIPYLVGIAIIKFKLPLNKQTLEYVINDLINSQIIDGNKGMYQYCNDINEYVVSVRDEEFCNNNLSNCTSFKSIANETTFYVSIQDSDTFASSIETFVNNIWNKYDKQIENGLFSWNGNKQIWLPFSKHELELISEFKP